MNINPWGKIALTGLALVSLVLTADAQDIPAELPDPDGKAGDDTRPIKVYILAGQSNMNGMGTLSGARCRYAGIYLTADPAAPAGAMGLYKVGTYRIRSHGVYPSADAQAGHGVTASIYKGAYDSSTDYDKAQAAQTETVALGVANGRLPLMDGPHTVVLRGCIDVPATGSYTINPGHGDSSYNVMELDGREVYRKDMGGAAVKQEVALEAGKRYPIKVTYFKGGSTALWLSQEDLLGKGDLEVLTKREKRFQNLIDDEGNWTVRHDVWYHEARMGFSGSPLSPTSNGKTIGPELAFGHVMGTYHDEQVLLIKTAIGNRALGFDYRPPSSGRNDPDSEWEGLEYRLTVAGVHKTLEQIAEIVPGYKGQGYELAGLVWWQGHKDGGTPEFIDEYDENLANLIKDLRKEFNAPKMLAVIATVGFGGYNMADKYVKILNAQMAVGDPAKYPEFAGTVATVDTRPFWRGIDDSPTNQDYHYNRNAETYVLVGDSLGRAMVRLLGGNAQALAQGARRVSSALPASSEPIDWNAPAVQAALAPIIMQGIARTYVANPRYNAALLTEASFQKPARDTQFLRGAMFGLEVCYSAAGVQDYDWHLFGPDLRSLKWEYHSFDPPESMPVEKGNRFRKVTYPKRMANWAAPDFDAAKAGWLSSLPPFGQLDGKLAPLSETCTASYCGCGSMPKTLWEKEVLLMRGTFEIPPLKEDHRYRLVMGGSSHVNAGEGFEIYVNGKLLAKSSAGVGRRQGGQPRGSHIHANFRDDFKGGQVTIAVTSFLRYNNPRGLIPARGHLSLWIEEAKVPPLGN